MSEPYAHLAPAVAEVADQSVDIRRAFARRDHWLGYDRAKKILTRLDSLVRAGPTLRSPGLALVAESNNGKSRIAERFIELNPAYEDEETGRAVRPVIRVELPASPDEMRLYDEIMTELWQPFRPKDRLADKALQVRSALERVSARMLIVDEVQNVLGARRESRRPLFDALRNISNVRRMPVVVLGTPDSLSALSTYSATINRFPVIELPLWPLNMEFRTLVSSFERLLPLREPSKLHAPKVVSLIHQMSGGRIGEVRDLLILAMDEALEAGQERIDLDLLAGLEWSSPDDRRRAADTLRLTSSQPK